MTQFYNIIASIGSRNSASGYGKISLVLMDEAQIINIASNQIGRRGETLQTLAGINWIEKESGDFEPERNWEEGEALEAAITEFTSDGHVYEIFKRTEQDAEFISRAADFGLEEEAIEFVK